MAFRTADLLRFRGNVVHSADNRTFPRKRIRSADAKRFRGNVR
jgi:hypothetical protein